MGWCICEKCGKKLIKRLPSGLFSFRFGKNNDNVHKPIVDIQIHGSIKMTCIKRGCNHENVFNYFPQSISIDNVSCENKSKFKTQSQKT